MVSFHIDHGAHPKATLFDHGFLPVRPLSANLVDGEIVFTWLVREVTAADRRPAERHTVYVSSRQELPRRHQRIGAYALVFSGRGILGTVNSTATRVPGTWALPGGGIDPGESPSDAVLREIYEETGQTAIIDRVLSLESDHWVGRSMSGVLEDFHALRIIYSAVCPEPTDAVVYDVGGSTLRSDWVALRNWRSLHWTNSSRTLLAQFARRSPRSVQANS